MSEESSRARWTRRELRVHGVRLSYVERETRTPSACAPVLMLHGLVAGGACFYRLGNELPADRRVVAVDLPGGGQSERPRHGDARFRSTAELVLGLMEALGVRRPVLLGHSYGGVIALEIASWRPDALDSMILLAPAHPFSHREDLLVRFYLSRLGTLFAHTLPWLPRRVLLEAFRRMPGNRKRVGYDDIAPYMETLRQPGTVDYILRLLRSWQVDMRSLGEALSSRRCDVPALALWGDLDPIVPASTGKKLMQYLSAGEQITLRGVGHLPNDERPQQCAELIRAWLENCNQPASVARG